MTKEQAITTAKQFRKELDDILQRMKEHTSNLKLENLVDHQRRLQDTYQDLGEATAQHIISTRDLESCIMRQGMALKYIGNPNPYPNSKDPSNTVVEPTADNLKM